MALLVVIISVCQWAGALTFSDQYTSPRNPERIQRKETRFIILHTTEAEASSSLKKLSRNGEAHYCVDRDGKVYRLVNRRRVAYHCGTSMWNGKRNIDDVSIGIEVVGYHDRVLTSAQYRALNELILLLQKLYAIKDINVMPHSQVAYGTPNRWHPRSHRGRKRCGMGYATSGIRRLLGLKERWLSDPDVKARRLVVGDSYLSQVLYAKNGERLLPYKVPTGISGGSAEQKAENVSRTRSQVETIQRGRSAWDIARDAYNAPSTLYIAPNGQRMTGDKISDWSALVAGTQVILKEGDNDGSPVQTLTAGAHARSLIGDAVFAPDTWYIRPTGGSVQGSKLNEKTLAAFPPGTQILVGYTVGLPVRSNRLPSEICPSQWDAPDTFYLIPGQSLIPYKKMNMSRVPAGSLIFYRH
ncbi:MAG: N-acetylmuramoyl-L-alanine amidase [Kiritimatiellia bacterium]